MKLERVRSHYEPRDLKFYRHTDTKGKYGIKEMVEK
jgi:hypothetical protein